MKKSKHIYSLYSHILRIDILRLKTYHNSSCNEEVSLVKNYPILVYKLSMFRRFVSKYTAIVQKTKQSKPRTVQVKLVIRNYNAQ